MEARIKKRMIGALAGVVLVGTTCAILRPEPTTEMTTRQMPVTPVPPTVATMRFRLGLNEAVSVPRKLRAQPGFTAERLGMLLDSDAVAVASLGATIVRGHTANLPPISMIEIDAPQAIPALEQADLWVQALQAHQLEGVLMVSPWPGNASAESTDHYVPDDMNAYAAYVRRVVERYDGDGLEDMPGLSSPIRYWEVDNEPDLKNTLPPREKRDFDPSRFCLPEEYATVLVASAKAIREAFPAAKVLGGGFYRPHAESGAAYMRAVFAVEGTKEAIDILSLHTYHDDETGDRLVDGIRTAREILPNHPVWVTETNVTSVGEAAFIDEAYQARMVATLAARSAAEGVETMLWHSLVDPPSRREGPGGLRAGGLFSVVPLVKGGPVEEELVEKPAARVYRDLAGLLAIHDAYGASYDGQGAVRLGDGSVILYAGERLAPHGGRALGESDVGAGEMARAPAFLSP